MERSAEIKKYIDVFKRRIYWVVIPFLIVVLSGMAFGLLLEPVYQAETLILVQPQEVPKAYVESIVQSGVEERLRTITQQVTSRTNLESIISQYELYQDTDDHLEAKVQKFRQDIKVNVGRGGRGGNTFGISFRHKNPEIAKDVTNTLASNFISENLRVRESQVLGTSSFLADELDSVRRRLEDREEVLKEYRERHFGAMPEQLQANLSMLSRMQLHLDQLNKSLQDAQNRKLMLQQQIHQEQRMAEQMAAYPGNRASSDSSKGSDGSELGRLASLRGELEDLQARYTENHPDVRRLKSTIEKVEVQEGERAASLQLDEDPDGPELPPADTMSMISSSKDMIKLQLGQVDYEIASIRSEIAKANERLEMYQRRVEETPKREQEILSIKRDYENLKNLYDSLLNRKLEAELASSMEKKQKGEQFRILDPAKRPEIPVEPDLRKILLLTFVLALGLGGGLGYVKEMTDTSYKEPVEITEDLGVPVLISLPFLYARQEEKALRIKKWLKAIGVALGFIALATGIVLVTKGLNSTIGFVTRVLPFIGD
ncbi:MAG: XrtA system polysaccharide chain length determinant [Thermodesulfobacteriota bacterium]